MTVITNVRHYATKPHDVDAVRWLGTAIEATPVINWVLAHGGTARYHDPSEPGGERIAVDTYHGTVSAIPGDFIVKDQWDQFDVADPSSFLAIYTEVQR